MPAFLSPAWLCLLLLIGGAAYHERFALGHLLTGNASVRDTARRETAARLAGRGYAPPGTFYLVRYASVRTPTGVYGFEPGCEVQLLQFNDDQQTMVVSDGKQVIEVERALLTNNLDVADAVRRADQAAQTAIFNERMRQRWEHEISQRSTFIAHARDAHEAEVRRVREAAIGGAFSSPLDLPAQPVGVPENTADNNGTAPRTRYSAPSVMEPDDAALYSAINDLSTDPRTMLSGTR